MLFSILRYRLLVLVGYAFVSFGGTMSVIDIGRFVNGDDMFFPPIYTAILVAGLILCRHRK